MDLDCVQEHGVNMLATKWLDTKRTIVILGLAAATLLSGCAAKNFEASSSPSAADTVTNTGGGDTCTTTNVDAIYKPTKIIFVVDTSGSNANITRDWGAYINCGYGGSCLAPTDPTKAFRHNAIQNFLTRFKTKTNFSWGFETFSSDAAVPYIYSGSVATPTVSADPNVLQNALNSFMAVTDQGNTPYSKALNLAAQTIANDKASSSVVSDYYVVMLTDGHPTDYYSDTGTFNSSLYNTDMAKLLGTSSGHVNLSTVYYGNNTSDTAAQNLLSAMASQGGGQFVDVNTVSTFKIDDVIPGSTTGCSN